MRNSLPRTTEDGRLVRQCAWCWAVADATGAYARQAPGRLGGATHGICPSCRAAVRSTLGPVRARGVALSLR